MRAGFEAETQGGVRMGGAEFSGQPEHVVVRAANDPVTAHLGTARRREAHGDGGGVHVQADIKDGTVLRGNGPPQDLTGRGGRGDRASPWGATGALRLDSFGLAE